MVRLANARVELLRNDKEFPPAALYLNLVLLQVRSRSSQAVGRQQSLLQLDQLL
jgi:hypothetical protein